MKKIISISILALVFTISTFALYGQENKDEDHEAENKISENKFIPSIAFVLDLSAVNRNINNDDYGSLEVPGFIYGHGHDDDEHSEMHGNRGYNLNYGELKLSGRIDKYFNLMTAFHLNIGKFDIEKAFIETSCLPYGFQITAGKFFVGFGYLNNHDAHDWDFADQNLVYTAFFGSHGINEVGVQLKWKAPIDIPLVIGAEVLRGANEMSFRTEGIDAGDATGAIHIEGSNGPGLYAGFIKSEINISKLNVEYGVSFIHGRTRINSGIDDTEAHEREAIDAKTWLLGGELLVKYTYSHGKYILFQNEYIYRSMTGDLYVPDETEGFDKMDLEKKQSGFYSQLIVKPFVHWRFGVRLDYFHLNDITVAGKKIEQEYDGALYRISGMTDFCLTKKSNIRLQYNLDKSKYLHEKQKDNHEIILQFNMFLGTKDHDH